MLDPKLYNKLLYGQRIHHANANANSLTLPWIKSDVQVKNIDVDVIYHLFCDHDSKLPKQMTNAVYLMILFDKAL